MALPLVVGLMLLSALLVMGVAAVSLTSVSSASTTRDGVQSQSSAEAGVAAAQASIIQATKAGTALPCDLSSNATGLFYDVKIQYGANIPGTSSSCVDTSSVSAKTAVIVSEGRTTTSGTQRSTTGNIRRVQAVLTFTGTSTPAQAATTAPSTASATSTTSSTSPAFKRAVFIGSGTSKSSGNWTLKNGSSSTGGFYLNGTLECSQINVQGPAVVYGGAAMNGGDCVFGQGLTVSQNLTACTNTKITGILTVGGNASSSSGCTVTGDAYVGGDFACGTSVSGLLSVQGAINGGWGCSAGSDLRVGGDLGANYYTVSGAVVSSKGTVSRDAQGNVGSLTVKTRPSSSPGGLRVGGTSCGWGSAPACTIKTSDSTGAPPTSPVVVPSSAEPMPVITAASLGASTAWASLVRARYVAHGTTQSAENRFMNPGDTCSIIAPASVQRDGDSGSLNGPLDAPADVSVVDARGCSTLSLRASTIVLNGDLTLLVNSFYSTKGISVVKGSAVPSGTTPVLRIVTPMADGTSTCAANSSANTIKFDSGGSSLGSDVSMLLYSSGEINMSNSLSFYGQMVSCAIPNLQNDITINYRSLAPAGSSTGAPTSIPPATATPSSTPSTAASSNSSAGWSLRDVRDLSRG